MIFAVFERYFLITKNEKRNGTIYHQRRIEEIER